MSLTNVLENWSEYDNKKKKGQDARYFSCTEAWEVDYLINKIKKVFPELGSAVIKEAIEHCCRTVKEPRPRKEFVTCVLRRLGKSL